MENKKTKEPLKIQKEKKISEIVDAFNLCARDFAERSRALCEFETSYKGKSEKVTNISQHRAKIFFNNYIIVFEYTPHGFFSLSHSILSCYICFDKAKENPLYPMYSVLDIVDPHNFESYIIPFITNGEIMTQCFNRMAASLEKYFDSLAAIAGNPEVHEKLFNNFMKDLSIFYKFYIDQNNYEHFLKGFYPLYINRFTTEAYIDFLRGNYQKAARKYGKNKNKLLYEQRLLAEINRRLEKAFYPRREEQILMYYPAPVPPAIVENIVKHNLGRLKLRDAGILYVLLLLMTFLMAIPYGAIFYLLYLYEKSGALFLASPNIVNMVLPCVLSGIIAMYYLRFMFYKIFYKKDYEKKAEMDFIINSPGSERFIRWMTGLILAASLITTVLSVKDNVKFMDDYLIDNTGFFSLQGSRYAYSQVERIYYRDFDFNDNESIFGVPSYIIVFKDGREIDLLDYEEDAVIEEKLLPLLEKRGVKIERRENN